MIELSGDEHRILRAFGCDPDLIAASCHARPKWLDDLMKVVALDADDAFTFHELRIALVAFALWLLKDEPGEGREVELVDKFIRETT